MAFNAPESTESCQAILKRTFATFKGLDLRASDEQPIAFKPGADLNPAGIRTSPCLSSTGRAAGQVQQARGLLLAADAENRQPPISWRATTVAHDHRSPDFDWLIKLHFALRSFCCGAIPAGSGPSCA
jgi:hypothetical protein